MPAITHQQLIDGLKERGQAFLANYLQINNHVDLIAHPGTQCDASLSTPNNIDDLVTQIIAAPNFGQLNDLLNNNKLMPLAPPITFNQQAFDKLTTSKKIVKACKELGIEKELKPLLDIILIEPNIANIHAKLETANDAQIKELVKIVNGHIAALNIPPAPNAVQAILETQYALVAGGNYQVFRNGQAVLAETAELTINKARLAVLKNDIRFPGGHAVADANSSKEFIALLDSNLASIKLANGRCTKNNFRADLFTAMVAEDDINNSPKAFADALERVLKGMAPGAALPQPAARMFNTALATFPDVAFRNAVDDLNNPAKSILSQGQRAYLNLMSTPKLRQQPMLYALLKKPGFRDALVTHWNGTAPPADFAAVIDQINTNLNTLLPGVPTAGNFDAVRQSLATTFFTNPAGLNGVDIGFNAVGNEVYLLNEVKHFQALKAQPQLAGSPAFEKMLIDLSKLQVNPLNPLNPPDAQAIPNFKLLSDESNFAVLPTLDLAGQNVLSARDELAKFFHGPNITAPNKAIIDDIIINNNPPRFSDDLIKEIIGEARLKKYFGDNFAKIFSSDVPDALNKYVDFCRVVGGYDRDNWVNELAQYEKRILNGNEMAGNADHEKLIRGYARICEVYGKEFLSNLPANRVKEAANKIGGLAANNWKDELVKLQDNLVRRDAIGFRSAIGANNALMPGVAKNEIGDDVANKEIGILRVTKLLDKELLSILRDTAINAPPDKNLFEFFATVAAQEPLWESKLTQVVKAIKENALNSDPADAIKKLGDKLDEVVHSGLAPFAGKLLGQYRFERLKDALKEQGLADLAERIDVALVGGHNFIKEYLAEHALPEDMTAKIQILQKEYAAKLPLINDSFLLNNKNGHLHQFFANFLTGLVDGDAQRLALAKALVGESDPINFNADTKLLIESTYQQLLNVVTQFVGIEAVERFKSIEAEIKAQIGKGINNPNPGNLSAAILNYFARNNLIEKASILRGALAAAANDNEASNAVQAFLGNLVPNIADAANKVITHVTPGTLNANNADYVALNDGAKRAEAIAAIEDPEIAQWLQEYKRSDGKPLALNYQHVNAINSMLRKLSFHVLRTTTSDQIHNLVSAEIKRLKLAGELPDSFPDKLFTKVDKTHDKAYSYTTWRKEFYNASILRKIEDPVLRQFALNDKKLLNVDTDALNKDVTLINSRLRLEPPQPEVPHAPFQSPIQPNDYAGTILQGTRLSTLFVNNVDGENRCAQDAMRAIYIRANVKNSEMASLLINNPRAFKHNTPATVRNMVKDFVNGGSHGYAVGGLASALAGNKAIYDAYIASFKADQLRNGNMLTDEDLAELLSEQTYKNCVAAQTFGERFVAYGQYNTDKGNLLQELEIFAQDGIRVKSIKTKFEEALKEANDLLNKTNPATIILHDTEGGIKRAEAVKKSLESLQAALILKRDELRKEREHFDLMANRLKNIDELSTPPNDFFPNQNAKDNSDIVDLRKNVETRIKEIDNILNGYKINGYKIDGYNDVIAKASDHLQEIEKGIANTQKVIDLSPTITSGFGRNAITFDPKMAFHVKWVKPSNELITTCLERHYKDPTASSDLTAYKDLKRPESMGSDAILTFTSQGAKTIVTKENDQTLRIKKLPDRKSDKKHPAIEQKGGYKEEMLSFAKGYYRSQKHYKKCNKSDLKHFAGLTVEQIDQARQLASFIYRYHEGGSITISGVADKELGAWLIVELHILAKKDGRNVKIYGGLHHGYDDARLESAAQHVMALRDKRDHQAQASAHDVITTTDKVTSRIQTLKVR